MKQSQLIWGLVVVFSAIALSQVVMGALYTPALYAVALPFAAAAYLLWYHVSGRMAENVRKRVERRNPWEDARAEARASERSGGFGADATAGTDGGRRTRAPPSSDRMAPEVAYRTLGVDSGASADEVRRAYREKVKQTHPDREGGDEGEFKRVTEAYERVKADR